MSDVDNAVLYCGYHSDAETTLYHVRNRMYNAELGRFIQRDPLGYIDGMSVYEYVGSKPSERADLLGLEATEKAFRDPVFQLPRAGVYMCNDTSLAKFVPWARCGEDGKFHGSLVCDDKGDIGSRIYYAASGVYRGKLSRDIRVTDLNTFKERELKKGTEITLRVPKWVEQATLKHERAHYEAEKYIFSKVNGLFRKTAQTLTTQGYDYYGDATERVYQTYIMLRFTAGKALTELRDAATSAIHQDKLNLAVQQTKKGLIITMGSEGKIGNWKEQIDKAWPKHEKAILKHKDS
jgi:RHS repeat-associated protein